MQSLENSRKEFPMDNCIVLLKVSKAYVPSWYKNAIINKSQYIGIWRMKDVPIKNDDQYRKAIRALEDMVNVSWIEESELFQEDFEELYIKIRKYEKKMFKIHDNNDDIYIM